MTNTDIADVLRRRIVADLHLGRLKPGDRLPSLRTIAREMNVSIRTAARGYALLERDGLVTVRGRSGIYLVAPFAVEIKLEEPLAWYAEMLKDAWSRRIALMDVTQMLSELVEHPMTVACVESTEDHMIAFCAELGEDFSLTTSSVKLTPTGASVDGIDMSVEDALSGVDFIVTTAFHASDVYAAAESLSKPVVIVSVNETLVETFENELSAGAITIIADDPAFVERFRMYLSERFRNRGDLRIYTMTAVRDDPSIATGSTVLYTRAARKRLNAEEFHLLPRPVAFLSDRAAQKVLHCMLSMHGKRALQPA
jgi:DNA-binding transcriptional regulator YhcF (GntR family)